MTDNVEMVEVPGTKGQKRIFYFYNRKIQIRYALTAIAIVVVVVVAYTFLIYSHVSKIIDELSASGGVGVDLRAMAQQSLVAAIAWGSLLCIFIAGGTSAFWVMLITHRYEGPMVRINKHLSDLAKGVSRGPLEVRKRDELRSIVKAVNELTVSIEANRNI